MKVKIYSTPSCPYCKMAKEYFSSKGVEFQNIDVSGDKSALDEMVKLSGQMGVPVIVIGSEVVVGFDKSKIEKLLEK